MKSTQSTLSTRMKVGLFGVFGILAIIGTTIWVNDRPFWYRKCQLVHINVEDATGLKTKSPVRSLGLEIGYLDSVELSETFVTLGICITAPVEVLPATRAYIRGEGFMGDKFVELKPVKYIGAKEPSSVTWIDWLIPSAYAEPARPDSTPEPLKPRQNTVRRTTRADREIPVGEESQDVQHLVNRVDELVNQMSGLTNNLKDAINPEDLRKTMKELNRTLENASKTLAPEGGLNQTAQRTLAKLEDAIEQVRDQLIRVNKGEGSVGMLLNDPTYAREIREAIRNVNNLLGRVGDVKFIIDLGGQYVPSYTNTGRGWFQLSIWPTRDRYYLLGAGVDPRGKVSQTTVTTTAGGSSTSSQVVAVEQSGLTITAQLGKTFFSNRLNLAVGVLFNDAAGTISTRLGPTGREDMIEPRVDIYTRGWGTNAGLNARAILTVRPLWAIYVQGGVDAFRLDAGQNLPFFAGAGLSFEDEDIKLLFALR